MKRNPVGKKTGIVRILTYFTDVFEDRMFVDYASFSVQRAEAPVILCASAFSSLLSRFIHDGLHLLLGERFVEDSKLIIYASHIREVVPSAEVGCT